MLNKLNGWLRAALLFNILWFICVLGLAGYERFVTIGDTSGPWVFFINYSSLIFHHVEISGDNFSFWLEKQKFYSVLILPPAIIWAITAGLFPALKWVRSGFST